MSTHLKPEQFNDWLLGIAGNETTAHLEACPQCRMEIEAMRQTLGSFRAAAVGWSEGAAKQVVLPKKPRAHPLWIRPVWVLAATAMILVVAILFSGWRGHVNKPVATADVQAQISRDNQLLEHIESEVSEITPMPMQPLQVNPKVGVR
jgi:anti-sigma factor RsiW